MLIGNQNFDVENHTYIMGILNITQDSFSDGGKYIQMDQALAHVEQMLKEGMDILDIGGESTRPGYLPVSEEEEMERVLPVIEAVVKRFPMPVSLDTSKSKVAKEGLKAGCHIINDIWGLQKDIEMAKVIADTSACCVLMHNREKAEYHHFMEDIISDLQNSLYIARKAGIEKNRIILDPGIGFAKNQEQNLQVLNNLKQMNNLGAPVLLGASRKSVIGNTLQLPVNKRLEGTLVTTVLAVLNGCSFVRVHDIEENKRVIKMTEAIMQSERES